MKKHGIIRDASYRAFLAYWRQENERRRHALTTGEPVYGPQQVSEQSFYAYVLSNGARELGKVLARTDIAANERDLRVLYESVRNTYAKGHLSRVKVISLPIAGDHGRIDDVKRAEARRELEVARQKILTGQQLDQVRRSLPHSLVRDQLLDSRASQRDRLGMSDPVAMAGLALSPQQVSAVHDRGSTCAIVWCVERTELGYVSFEDARPSLEARYVSIAYERYIDQRIREARVDIRQPAFDAVLW